LKCGAANQWILDVSYPIVRNIDDTSIENWDFVRAEILVWLVVNIINAYN
jgi:hypothetical protein